MTITIEIRSVYGQPRAYPACDTSRIFAEMLGSKTLTRKDLRHIEALGFEIAAQANADINSLA